MNQVTYKVELGNVAAIIQQQVQQIVQQVLQDHQTKKAQNVEHLLMHEQANKATR